MNEERKLYYHLKREYRELLNKFPEFKGAHGNLLYLMSIIPEIKSFKNIRSFLRYLGLRNAGRSRYWSREARQALVEIAYRISKKHGIRFGGKKPNWKFTRKIALIICKKLRDGGRIVRF